MEGRKEMFYLTTHSTHFIYGYMASDIWLRTILIVRKETRCRHIGYSFQLAARVLLYAPSHRQDSTYHGLCYTSCGALAGTRNSNILWMRDTHRFGQAVFGWNMVEINKWMTEEFFKWNSLIWISLQQAKYQVSGFIAYFYSIWKLQNKNQNL